MLLLWLLAASTLIASVVLFIKYRNLMKKFNYVSDRLEFHFHAKTTAIAEWKATQATLEQTETLLKLVCDSALKTEAREDVLWFLPKRYMEQFGFDNEAGFRLG